MSEVSLEVNTIDPKVIDEFINLSIKKMIDNVASVSEDILKSAKSYVNVDTGRLRANIEEEVTRVAEYVIQVAVGVESVEYAPFQEMGWPYLRPAFMDHKKDLLSSMKESMIEAAKRLSLL